MASPHREHDASQREPSAPRIVEGKPFEVVDGRLVKTGSEQWEIDGRDGPALDDHILDFDQRWMLVDGELIEMAPAREPHGRVHLRLATLLDTHVASDHEGFVDVLTRFDEGSDFAPDVSVRPLPDPITGHPTLEVLAFEICAEQSLSVNTNKARVMVARGVGQVYCLDLKRERVLAWDTARDDWREMRVEEVIVDASLAHALPVSALLDAGQRDAAVVAALRARRAPELEPVREEGRTAGHAQGRAEGHREELIAGLLEVLEVRGVELDPVNRERIVACTDLDQLRHWRRRAILAERIDDVLGDTPDE